MFPRLAIVIALAMMATACATDQAAPGEVVDVEWAPKVEATRRVNPVEFELFLSIELNEEAEAGHFISGQVDFATGLADLTNSNPLSGNPRSRVIVNGADAYLVTAAAQVMGTLPPGAEIIAGSLKEFEELGVVSMNPAILFGALGLLRGAIETRKVDPTTFELDLDPAVSLAGLNDAERRTVPLDLAGATDTFGFAEVTLASDGATIERFRLRISGTSDDGEILLTIDYRIGAYDTELTFDPPPQSSVVDLADYPAIAPAVAQQGPGF